MKYIKTYENLHIFSTAKDKINDMVSDVYVELEKTYLADGNKDYSYHISEESKKFSTYKILKFVNTIFNQKLPIDFDEIMSFLSDLEISSDNDEELDEESVKTVTQDIYNYIDELSDYELDNNFKLSQSINKYNL